MELHLLVNLMQSRKIMNVVHGVVSICLVVYIADLQGGMISCILVVMFLCSKD